jgi:predicted RNA-binding protein associated with RNAse of E/G family
MTKIRIEYIRPGKETHYYLDDLVSIDSDRLKTFVKLPAERAVTLTKNLVAARLIAPDRYATAIAKTFFFDEYFDLLEFYDEKGDLLGYYSDIASPLVKTDEGYIMTDWFLDIWLGTDGRLIELDLDEFEEAVAQNLLSNLEIEQARATFARLIEEARTGVYPHRYR